MADNTISLWKKVEEAGNKDLPKRKIELLNDIIKLAEKNNSYGDLLKAVREKYACKNEISPDSSNVYISEIENSAAATDSNSVLYAMYNSMLGKLYEHKSYHTYSLSNSERKIYIEKSRGYFTRSLSNPDVTAKYKAKDLYPYYQKKDKKNLLVTLSLEASMFKRAVDYFSKAGDRRNYLLMLLEDIEEKYKNNKDFDYVNTLDSLIKDYNDIDECCEVAIRKYLYMCSSSNYSIEEKIKLVRESLSRWKNWENSYILKNAEAELTSPMFRVRISNSQIAEDSNVEIYLEDVRNIKNITTTIWKTDLTSADIFHARYDLSDVTKLTKKITKGNTIKIKNSFDAPDYKYSEINFNTPKLGKGIYIIETSCDVKGIEPVYNILYVSNLFVVAEKLPKNQIRLAVVDIKSGHPVKDAQITVLPNSRSNNEYIKNVTCNDEGEAIITAQDYINDVFAYNDEDKYMRVTSLNGYFNFHNDNNTYKKSVILTDRSIYRPGQTVKVAVIAYKNIKRKDLEVEANADIKIKLLDLKYKVIEEKIVRTDKYGTASAEFVLPQKILSGTFTISTEDFVNTALIRVEEYKRPTFDVQFSELNTQYHFGDTVKVNAHAMSFAGTAVQGAGVKYKIKKLHIPWFYSNNYDEDMVIAEGRSITSHDGSFSIDVPLTSDSEDKRGFFYFIVDAEVTDTAGETHNATLTIPVSEKEVFIDCDIPEKIEKSKLHTMKISVKNNAYKDIETDVTFFIDNKKGYIVKANTDIKLKDIMSELPSGRHKISIEALGEKEEKDFILFSLEDKVPAVETNEWLYTTSDVFPSDNGSVFIQIGSSLHDVYGLYTMISGNKVLNMDTFEINNEIKTAELKYKNEYGDGVLINYVWVKNGQMYSKNVFIKKALPEKKLNLKWTTFRDRLIPGQQEKWILNVSRNNSIKTDASIAATLYDISLDNITGNEWKRVYGLFTDAPQTDWIGTRCNDKLYNYAAADIRHINYNSNYRRLYSINEACYENEYSTFTSDEIVCKSMALNNNPFDTYDDEPFGDTSNDITKTSQNDIQEKSMPVLRENMNETAFFYPSLTTDEHGDVNISFTLPESITTWKFMAFAHDKEMNNEVFTDKVIAKKDVMIQPNMPRFIRRSDKAFISARITNLSDDNICGTATLQICSAITGNIISEESKAFSLDKDNTQSVSFTFNSDIDEDFVICKFFAEGKNFSDGEQHYLNILSDKELITNTKVVTIMNAGETNIDTKGLFNKEASDSHFTIEYTDNPIWFAIQALPLIALDNKNDAISIAKTVYANIMAQHIANASPKTRDIINSWGNDVDNESLISNLQKNSELKDIALEETPWIQEAETETERMQRLHELFDDYLMRDRINNAITKLSECQLADGSWGWWKGMNGNKYVTVTIAEMLVRLNEMTDKHPDLEEITENAMTYLGEEAVKEIEEIKELDEYYITQLGVTYLYLRTFLKLSTDKYSKILMKKLEELKPVDMDIYEKSMAAIIFQKNGNEKLARQLMNSVMEHSVYTPENGRYFDTIEASYSWCDYKMPTQVMAIEALSCVYPEDKRTIAEMKQWLLQEKRTTSWETPINSVNAIYALTNGGGNMSSFNDDSVVKVNKKELIPTIKGLGYIKTSAEGSNFDVNVSKKTDNMSWLSLYGSYTSDIKDIEEYSSGLKIERKIETIGDVTPVVGSKVRVTITITADRDYDFVQVTDKRAACMEPVKQISGYNGFYYCSIKDNATYYYFDIMPKGRHIIETEYYIDRQGTYTTGVCNIQCAYAPAFYARTKADTIIVK